MPLVVPFDDGDDDIDSAFWPPVRENGCSKCRLQVNANVALARIAYISSSLAGGKGISAARVGREPCK